MFAKLKSCCLIGIEGIIIDIEVDISNGIPAFEIVGLADIAVKESKERVKAAIKNSQLEFPIKKITINLAPANFKKIGTSFDLGIAISILQANELVKKSSIEWIIIGELSLDGKVKPVPGILPIVDSCKKIGYKNVIVPYENLKEALIVQGMNIIGGKSLLEVVKFLNDEEKISIESSSEQLILKNDIYDIDMADVKGQRIAKRALEISAAGNHSILMIGSPGSGKTMLAKRMPTILPNMTHDEAIEVTKIYSILGLITQQIPIIKARPFRDPHHSISGISLVGGGRYPKPGEISLANNGVLFLDELPEFKRESLDILREPLEEGTVNISRITHSVRYPANVLLICAANPCKCGYYLDDTKECKCTQGQISRYLGRLSGPFLDRIDIQIEITQVKYDEIYSDHNEESSAQIRKRVKSARKIQNERFKDYKIYTNSQLNQKYLKKFCKLDSKCQDILKKAFMRFNISARANDKIIKIARTIADLDLSENICEKHIAEAIRFRCMDKNIW